MALLPHTWCWWQGSPDSRHGITGRSLPLQEASAALWVPWTLLSSASLPCSQASQLLGGAEHAQAWSANLGEMAFAERSFPPTFHPKWKKFWPLWVHEVSANTEKDDYIHLQGIRDRCFLWFFNNWENFWKPQKSVFPFLGIFVQPCQLYLHTVSTFSPGKGSPSTNGFWVGFCYLLCPTRIRKYDSALC